VRRPVAFAACATSRKASASSIATTAPPNSSRVAACSRLERRGPHADAVGLIARELRDARDAALQPRQNGGAEDREAEARERRAHRTSAGDEVAVHRLKPRLDRAGLPVGDAVGAGELALELARSGLHRDDETFKVGSHCGPSC
jgi:hypothetical protein